MAGVGSHPRRAGSTDVTDRTDDLDNLDLASLMSEEEFAETYEGASTYAPDAVTPSPIVAEDATGAGNAASGEGVVTLRNIQSPEQVFGLHENGAYTGRSVGFLEGVLITDRDTANQILAVAPHVHEEPTSGPIFTHPDSKFATRSPEVFAEYTLRRSQAQV